MLSWRKSAIIAGLAAGTWLLVRSWLSEEAVPPANPPPRVMISTSAIQSGADSSAAPQTFDYTPPVPTPPWKYDVDASRKFNRPASPAKPQ